MADVLHIQTLSIDGYAELDASARPFRCFQQLSRF
jgi:hypothetical protein